MKQHTEELLVNNYEIINKIINQEAVIKLGDVEFTSGKIIIGDFASNISTDNELAETFPIGKFPIYYFSIYESGIFIPFVNEEPVNWKVALFNSQKKTKLKSFDLETGNFCITDSDGHAAILKNESNNLYSVNFWEDEIISRYIQEDCEWYYNILIANSKNNLITINTEQIDEIFKSYIGYDLTGNIVCLYTDLGSVMF